MHGAGLSDVLPDRRDRLGQPGQSVAAGDQHVLDAAVGQLSAAPAQNLAPSWVCTQMPSTCLMPSRSTPTTRCAALLDVHAVADLDHQRVNVDDRLERLERPACQVLTSSAIASVTLLIVACDRSMPNVEGR